MADTQQKEILSGNPLAATPDEIEFEMEEGEDGSLEITLGDDEEDSREAAELFQQGEHFEDLSVYLEEDTLSKIAQDVIDSCEADKESRGDWENILKKGIDSLGLNNSDIPNGGYGVTFEGACTATHPLLLESAVKFQSKLTAELLPAKGPARTQIIGKKTEEKERQAQRVKDHLNYQLTQQMPEYYEEMDRMAFHLPLYGSCFKKCYYDQALGRPVSEFVHPDNFIVAETAKSLDTAERYTHIIEKSTVQLFRDMEAGNYRYDTSVLKSPGGTGDDTGNSLTMSENESIGHSPTYSSDENRVHTLYEQHVYMELPSDIDAGMLMPYVVTVDKESQTVICIRRNWDEDDTTAQMLQWFTHYKYVPGFGFHGLGLIHLLGDMQKTLTVILRALVDAGQFANLQGGFKQKGIRLAKESMSISPGEFIDVDTAGQDLAKAIVPLPFKEPSPTLYQLLEYITGASQKFADSTEQVIQDSSNYGPVGTTMALLEASVKFFSAIHKRCHRAQGRELKILARINYDFLPDEYPYEVVGDDKNVFRKDYDPGIVDVIPASDPNVTSQAHRISLAQSKLQAALQAPQLHNAREVFKDFYVALGVEDVERILPPEDQPQPQDPMSDILSANDGKPIRAFPGQDHEAHVAFKMAWLQDPTQGGSGLFNSILPAMQANIREHQIMAFQEKVAGAVQVTGAATDQASQQQVLAKAAQMVSEQNKKMAEEQAMGGPAGMMAQAELLKGQADMLSAQTDANESQFDRGLKLLDTINSWQREQNRAAEAGRKISNEEKKIEADLMKKSAELAIGYKDQFRNRKN